MLLLKFYTITFYLNFIKNWLYCKNLILKKLKYTEFIF